MPTVSRQDRLWDLAALALIVLGAIVAVIATSQLREISKYSVQHPAPKGTHALEQADDARYLAYGGVLLILGGCGVAVASHRRHAQRQLVPPTIVS